MVWSMAFTWRTSDGIMCMLHTQAGHVKDNVIKKYFFTADL